MPPKRRRTTKKQGARPGEDYTIRLPAEMLSAVFDNCDQRFVLMRAARICHRWRAVAKEHKFFYAFVKLVATTNPTLHRYHGLMEAFAEKLRRAHGLKLRLSVDVHVSRTLEYRPVYGDGVDGYIEHDDLAEAVAALVLGPIDECMDSVISLVLRLPTYCAHPWPAAKLTSPAPLLQRISFTIGNPNRRRRGALWTPPDNLFASTAPKLRTVQLCGVSLDALAAVLRGAFDIQLDSYEIDDLLAIDSAFPTLSSLELSSLDITYRDTAAALLPPRLRSLELSVILPSKDRYARFAASISASSIPHITIQLGDMDIDDIPAALLDVPSPSTVSLIVDAGGGRTTKLRTFDHRPNRRVIVHSSRADFSRTLESSKGYAIRLPDCLRGCRELIVNDVLLPELCGARQDLPELVSLIVDFDCVGIIAPGYTVWEDLGGMRSSIQAPKLSHVHFRCRRVKNHRLAKREVDSLLACISTSTVPELLFSGVLYSQDSDEGDPVKQCGSNSGRGSGDITRRHRFAFLTVAEILEIALPLSGPQRLRNRGGCLSYQSGIAPDRPDATAPSVHMAFNATSPYTNTSDPYVLAQFVEVAEVLSQARYLRLVGVTWQGWDIQCRISGRYLLKLHALYANRKVLGSMITWATINCLAAIGLIVWSQSGSSMANPDAPDPPDYLFTAWIPHHENRFSASLRSVGLSEL
ncbi:hypothetical protein EXIGLDRAFT_809277 [Exidia glandulosa HHB12029]|uniref:F-box domain-containing protein n=1 Tax=Exidia glandulosa HHB12029 TaxID=1314781 RepID=A0A166BQ53_EXIGL|nr:hypothetical protein EXIGLDRAFT_809277 [Exidia glandulosa HHB12029]